MVWSYMDILVTHICVHMPTHAYDHMCDPYMCKATHICVHMPTHVYDHMCDSYMCLKHMVLSI